MQKVIFGYIYYQMPAYQIENIRKKLAFISIQNEGIINCGLGNTMKQWE